MARSQPLVSIVTPVYNGELYLSECIDSVLAQSFKNYEYIIVNNCSTDKSLEIAENYANKDSRIRVISNDRFVSADENHNIAFRQISGDSKYCKVVSADDWIYPECLTKLVGLAEKYPEIGIVGSYGISSEGIRWIGLPPGVEVFNGREACRLYLLGKIDFFAMPSGALYRSDLVRSTQHFYPGTHHKGDVDACFNCLQKSNLGFIHQILYFERIHDGGTRSMLRKLQGFLPYSAQLLKQYGAIFLTPFEMESRLDQALSNYYRVLSIEIMNLKGRKFINYHRSILQELGYPLFSLRLISALSRHTLDLVFNPKLTIEKICKRLGTQLG